MAIFIDTAMVPEARAALKLGWVSGIATNPVHLANALEAPEVILAQLSELTSGPIFYQTLAAELDAMKREVEKARAILGHRLVVKVPPTENGFRLAAQLSPLTTCCLTAVYSAAQAYAARETQAKYVAVYFSRAQEGGMDGFRLVNDLAQALNGSATELIAASLKSVEDAVKCLAAGARHVALPLTVIQGFLRHDLSEQAVNGFRARGRGLTVPKEEPDDDRDLTCC